MRRLLPLLLLGALAASCTQNTGGSFTESPTPPPTSPGPSAQLDLRALAGIRAAAAAALVQHIGGGVLEASWGGGAPAVVSGPYADSPPELGAMTVQALRSLATTPAGGAGAAGRIPDVSNATAQAFKQLDGPRGGAYLLLVDAAHPAAPGPPVAVDPTPRACPTPAPGAAAQPECLARQVSDGLMAAWYAPDTKMFFRVGETSTVYRPVDAITVGAALVVAGFQLRDDRKIEAGTNILQKEMKNDVDSHYGMLFGLVTATAAGGHTVTDYGTHLADVAGAAEAVLEAFDQSRENAYLAFSQKLLQPFLDERVQLHASTGGYLPGFDLQSSGPPDNNPTDVMATLLLLQAARHYDRDDGGHFAHLEESAAVALAAALDADRKHGGDPAGGVPAQVPVTGTSPRSGLVTALAVVVLGDVARDLGGPSPSP